MTRADSIRAKGLEIHVDAHCEKLNLKYRYKDLVNWIENGDEYGEEVSVEWLRRRFKTSRPTMEKWLMLYEEEKNDANSN